jgi:hypothetical protein
MVTNVGFVRQPTGSDPLDVIGKSDYAANAGQNWAMFGSGPSSLEQGDNGSYRFPNPDESDGIVFTRSELQIRQISDGTAKTYLLGEKYMNPLRYENSGTDGGGYGDDQGAYVSDERDVVRYTTYFNVNDYFSPLQDRIGQEGTWEFGSAHPGALHMATADGSVHSISYDIDPLVHAYLGNREDGFVHEMPFE